VQNRLFTCSEVTVDSRFLLDVIRIVHATTTWLAHLLYVRAVLHSNQTRLADKFMHWTGLGKCLQNYKHNDLEGSMGYLDDDFRRRRRGEAAALQKQPPEATNPRHIQ
jgi:hypothetical protein